MSEMNENIIVQNDSNISAKVDINFILSKIVQIMEDTRYIKETLDNLSNMQVSQGPGDIAGQGKALAISNIIEAREQTNRQTLNLLEKMYDDLKLQGSIKNRAFELVEKVCEKELDQGESILDLIEAIRYLDN